MASEQSDIAGVDRRSFTVESMDDTASDQRYWLTKSIAERLAALEQLRRTFYGNDLPRRRLQRVLEVAELHGS